MNVKGVPQTTQPATALRNKVPFPANTASNGNAGDYATNADQLAIYVVGTGWLFFTGFQQT